MLLLTDQTSNKTHEIRLTIHEKEFLGFFLTKTPAQAPYCLHWFDKMHGFTLFHVVLWSLDTGTLNSLSESKNDPESKDDPDTVRVITTPWTQAATSRSLPYYNFSVLSSLYPSPRMSRALSGESNSYGKTYVHYDHIRFVEIFLCDELETAYFVRPYLSFNSSGRNRN